jgi:hypothetical protein
MLLRILTVLEEVKETQRVHSSMIQSALRRLSEQYEPSELPPGVDLPLRSLEDLDAFEEKANEKTFCNAMVSFHWIYNWIFHNWAFIAYMLSFVRLSIRHVF